MFDKVHLREALVHYKKELAGRRWKDEHYKWEAVMWFQQHWNIEAENFSDMLSQSIAKTGNLLVSKWHFPAKMIKLFADIAPNEVRSMFGELFDETTEIYERIETFKEKSEVLLKQCGEEYGQHFQDENVIFTYLWLRYPDVYYIYKWSECKAAAEELGSSYSFKKGAYEENIRTYLAFYNEICEELQKDEELVWILQSQMTETCYPDPKLHTLTHDVVFYLSRQYSVREKEMQTEEWWLSDDRESIGEGIGKNVGENTDKPEKEKGTETRELEIKELEIKELETKELEAKSIKPYSKEDFLNEVYLSESQYNRLMNAWKKKKNIILQGVPGVGKTFAAKRLAYAWMGEKDESRIVLVQFHQSYSYEDFVIGYKPTGDGFELQEGIFYQFCQKAAQEPQKEYFFIMDEINRGNLSKIFGELLMLLENSYRETEVTLAYGGKRFKIPENVYLLGMMNTADRNLALMDYALRRRFSFFEMEPEFDSEGFLRYQKGISNDKFDELIVQIKRLNQEIREDPSLGKGFCIGHSYFCNMEKEPCIEEALLDLIEYDILPMLGEYWFDNEAKLQKWEQRLRDIVEETNGRA